MKQRNLEILVGPPCVGKSTYTSKRMAEGYYRIGRDDIRMMFNGTYVVPHDIERAITAMTLAGVKSLLDKDQCVVVDQTNLKLSYLFEFVEYHTYATEVRYVFFKDPGLDVLLERNKKRSIATGYPEIPVEIMTRLYNDYTILLETLDGLRKKWDANNTVHVIEKEYWSLKRNC